MQESFSFENAKLQAAQLGKRLGEGIARASLAHAVKNAWFSVLQHATFEDISYLTPEFSEFGKQVGEAIAEKKWRTNVDSSTCELVLHEQFVRAACAAAAGFSYVPLAEALRTLNEHYTVELEAGASEQAQVKHVLESVGIELQTILATDTPEEMLGEDVLHPPAHAWEGPQPGLLQQVDETHRYTYSQDGGHIESTVAYAADGQPYMRVHYRVTSGTNARPEAFEVERWVNGVFEPYGIVTRAGAVIPHQSLPRHMVDAEGVRKPIPLTDPHIFITPAGVVVRLVESGSFLRKPRAEYKGRLPDFDPFKPFVMQTAYGEAPIGVERADIIISPQGHVYELAAEGKRAVGELVIRERAAAENVGSQPFIARHEYFTAHIGPQDLKMDIVHPRLRATIEAPLSAVGGKHTFIHSHVPELIDIHGSTAAEESLRRLERRALELGLVLHALRAEQRGAPRAALLKAQYALEDFTWSAARELEEVLSVQQHSVVHVPSVRMWVEKVAEHPLEAIHSLQRSTTIRYVPHST